MPEEQKPQSDLLAVILEMRNGAVARDCNEKFNEVVHAVLETAQGGKLTIEISISPARKSKGGAVVEVSATHKIKMTKPELGMGPAMFFVRPDGVLTREDPQFEDQAELFQERKS